MVNLLPLALILAQTTATAPPPPAAPAQLQAPPAQEVALRKLSKRERKERIEKLEVRHQDFLEDVEPIMLSVELDTFLSLQTDPQRDAFVDDFWRRRDPAQGTTFREMYYRRLDAAKQQFQRITTDRARMYLLHGPPAAITRTECQRLLTPLEIWKYESVPGLGQGIWLLFYKQRGGADYRLWNAMGGAAALSDLMAQDPFLPGAEEATSRSTQQRSASPYAYINRIQLECREGDQIMRAITQMVQSRIDLLKLFEPQGGSDEDVGRFVRSLVVINPAAPKLNAELDVGYPGKEGSRTNVQMTVLVPREQLTPSVVGRAEVYTLDVMGEVLRDGNLWEKYRYRFDFPGDLEVEKIPLVVDRFLRPDDYVSRIKITDATSGAEVVLERRLEVPQIYTPVEEEPPAVPEMQAATPTDMKKEDLDPKKARLRIVPPPTADFVSGVRTIETIATGPIEAVEFSIDGKKIAIRRAPPFALDFDFGTIPQTRRIRAVALDAAGTPITGDEVEVNAGTDPFRVRIASPRVAPVVDGPIRMDLDVRVPDGEELATVELFWNETRLAVLFDPPFVQTVNIPQTQGVGYLRAVAKLKDASIPPVEDLVLVNSPAYMEELNVHLVELPTTVIVDGKPSSKLDERAFRVFDEGKPVQLSKFEYVRNLPLSIGLAVDVSGSMATRMDEALMGGAQFVERIMRRGDKAFLVAFNEDAEVVQKWSTRVADIHAGLARLRAQETTALYDAIVFSLYNFQSIRGQKALVVISDGRDTASKFTWDHAFDYARRSGVPIYAIGLGITGADADVRFRLQRLCSETGGSVYYIEQARELQKVYGAIEAELRSQYVLGFYPGPDVKPGGKWREVTVQTSVGKARTIRGYFP